MSSSPLASATNNTAIEDALGHTVKREFDGQDHVIRTVDPRANVTSSLYDGNHNLTRATDALGKTSHFTYDALHRLTDTADPLDHRSHNVYDSEHHLVQSTVYPAAGSSVSIARAYYNNGQLQTSRDGRDVATTLTYDSLGNPATSTVGSHPAVTYTYDAIGRMTALTDQAGATAAHAHFPVSLCMSLLPAQHGPRTGRPQRNERAPLAHRGCAFPSRVPGTRSAASGPFPR
ncbi:RHS repeat domain-containing protein [Desulfobulbus elongatus]|uniref:RHS repeat domain-containing protein n=1 Tax=Desulfobulbus elongatus TaxID=53332 RepID=UPI0004802F13|nr:RHS repeat protein [Desulfobulbus elongatus]